MTRQLISPAGLPALFPQTHLTLTAGTAYPTADVTGATTLYCVQLIGTQIPVFDGSDFINRDAGTGISLPLDSNAAHTGYQESGKNFGVFAVWEDGELLLTTGPSWNAGAVAGSDIARGTGAGSCELETWQGYPVNKNTMTVRYGTGAGDTLSIPARQATYLGDARATANGQFTDSKAQRLLFNQWNSRALPLQKRDTGGSYTYSTFTLRQARATAGNQVEFLLGTAGKAVDLTYGQVITGSSGTDFAQLAIGLDSTTTASPDATINSIFFPGSYSYQAYAKYVGFPGLGYHRLVMLEAGGGSGTQTFHGTSDVGNSNGMLGTIL